VLNLLLPLKMVTTMLLDAGVVYVASSRGNAVDKINVVKGTKGSAPTNVVAGLTDTRR
jgi:hypothetical protein